MALHWVIPPRYFSHVTSRSYEVAPRSCRIIRFPGRASVSSHAHSCKQMVPMRLLGLPCSKAWKALVKDISIPLVSLLFTWWHVWLGIQMCFYPVEFVGCCKPYLGWQGYAWVYIFVDGDKVTMAYALDSLVFHAPKAIGTCSVHHPIVYVYRNVISRVFTQQLQPIIANVATSAATTPQHQQHVVWCGQQTDNFSTTAAHEPLTNPVRIP